MMRRCVSLLCVAALLSLLTGCASSGSSSYSRGSRSVYRGGSVHYNSFPGAYEYRGRMGMPY